MSNLSHLSFFKRRNFTNNLNMIIDNYSYQPMIGNIKQKMIFEIDNLIKSFGLRADNFQLFEQNGSITIVGLDDFLLKEENIIDVTKNPGLVDKINFFYYDELWVIKEPYEKNGTIIAHNHLGKPAKLFKDNAKAYILYNTWLNLPEYLEAIGKPELINFL